MRFFSTFCNIFLDNIVAFFSFPSSEKNLIIFASIFYELCKDFMIPKWDKEVYLRDISLWQVYFLDTDSLII